MPLGRGQGEGPWRSRKGRERVLVLTGVLPGAPRIRAPLHQVMGGGGWAGCFMGSPREGTVRGASQGGPRRGTVNEQTSAPSGLPALFMGKQEGRPRVQRSCPLPGGGWAVGTGAEGKEGWAPVQRNGRVQEGGHQLGGVVPGQQGDGLQGIFLGLGMRMEQSCRWMAQPRLATCAGRKSMGRGAGLGKGPGPRPRQPE